MTVTFAAIPALIALASAPANAPASVGVGIQAGPVCPATTVAQGGTYTLPPIQVADTGSGSVGISLAVIRQSDPRGLSGKPVPASWVTFTYPRTWGGLIAGSSVGVGPGEAALVLARLTVPSSAATGSYVAWIQPQAAGAPVSGHANFGGTGEADLEFTVTGPGVSRHVTCVTPGVTQAAPAAGNAGGGTVGAPAASVTPAGTAGKTIWLIIAAVVGACGLCLIFGRRSQS